jgi:hypothetical protein
MARAPALHAGGREFESLTVHYHWSIRSSARMPPCHGGEAGSIPAWTAHSGVDWSWFQLGLISRTTWVRIPLEAQHRGLEKRYLARLITLRSQVRILYPLLRWGDTQYALELCVLKKEPHLFAEVAQLIERKPSKLQVAGLSPVFRSKKS